MRVAKTKALISFAVTAKLICIFVFAYAKSRFSRNEAQLFFYYNGREIMCLNSKNIGSAVLHLFIPLAFIYAYW